MKKTLPPINDVTISTATVDIQVIRIGTKQMTLAVFRQIPRKSIIDKSGNLIELPWGWINYDKGYGLTPFVYSHHGTLYRSDIPLREHHHLEIKAETQSIQDPKEEKWMYPKTMIEIPTGNFIIQSKDSNSSSQIYLLFDSEAGAQGHLKNRLASIAILETAPQLFIGV